MTLNQWKPIQNSKIVLNRPVIERPNGMHDKKAMLPEFKGKVEYLTKYKNILREIQFHHNLAIKGETKGLRKRTY